MAVSLRLRRMGRRKRPHYALVAADSRSARDGKFIEDLGRYEPVQEPAVVLLHEDRILDWLLKGAQPSDTVKTLLRKQGIMLRLHLLRKGKSEEEITQAVEQHQNKAPKAAPAVATKKQRAQEALRAERERVAAAEAERAKVQAAERARQEQEAEEARRREFEERQAAQAAQAAEAARAQEAANAATTEAQRQQEAANAAQSQVDFAPATADAPAETPAMQTPAADAETPAATDEGTPATDTVASADAETADDATGADAMTSEDAAAPAADASTDEAPASMDADDAPDAADLAGTTTPESDDAGTQAGAQPNEPAQNETPANERADATADAEGSALAVRAGTDQAMESDAVAMAPVPMPDDATTVDREAQFNPDAGSGDAEAIPDSVDADLAPKLNIEGEDAAKSEDVA